MLTRQPSPSSSSSLDFLFAKWFFNNLLLGGSSVQLNPEFCLTITLVERVHRAHLLPKRVLDQLLLHCERDDDLAGEGILVRIAKATHLRGVLHLNVFVFYHRVLPILSTHYRFILTVVDIWRQLGLVLLLLLLLLHDEAGLARDVLYV